MRGPDLIRETIIFANNKDNLVTYASIQYIKMEF